MREQAGTALDIACRPMPEGAGNEFRVAYRSAREAVDNVIDLITEVPSE